MIENNAMFKLSYGLYVLTAREDGKDNGCIVNGEITARDKTWKKLLGME